MGTGYMKLSSARLSDISLAFGWGYLFLSMIHLIYHRNTTASLSKFLYSDSENKVRTRKDGLRTVN